MSTIVEEVVVTATRVQGNGGIGDFRTENQYYGEKFSRSGGSSPGSPGISNGTLSDDPRILVKTESNDAASTMRLDMAVMKLANVVAKIDEAVVTLPDTATIHMPDGSTITGAQFKAIWHAIDFTISDEVVGNFSNNGYGAIDRDASGFIRDVMSVSLFEQGSYGDANYPDNQGITFLVFHEIGHMAPGGESQYNRGHIYWNQETSNPNSPYYLQQYNGSEYWTDNEKWSNDFAAQAGAVLGFNQAVAIQQVGMGSTGFGWIDPNDLHSSHEGYRPAPP